ncbi:hypothetical protein USDA257_c44810 [Sinorhizobium fredii USDA 257]|uniref:Uncharacterized protein n=1 Tax=Sinorhizobium fredii (strain USDA 257) TaxID=1185652 RepID=I3XAW3_SINF2|nr:hypothetical protein USDA257_c44810 [Sinorhizobium fredii USDA 257]
MVQLRRSIDQQTKKAARSIMAGGLFETKAMPKHRLLAGL